jgi:peroxiredoxin
VASATDVQPAVGHRAPAFTLRDPDGKAVQLSRVLKEKAVFLNFWATWCPPCREEMPSMEAVYRDYKARGLEILAVSIDAGDETAVAARVKAFMADLTLTFPALLDPQMEVVRAYRLRGLPTTYLIDRTGVIRAIVVGPRDWASPEFRQRLDALVK